MCGTGQVYWAHTYCNYRRGVQSARQKPRSYFGAWADTAPPALVYQADICPGHRAARLYAGTRGDYLADAAHGGRPHCPSRTDSLGATTDEAASISWTSCGLRVKAPNRARMLGTLGDGNVSSPRCKSDLSVLCPFLRFFALGRVIR